MTQPPPAQPDALGGRYQLGTVIGRGGMAEVYQATDRVLGRQVAVKVLRLSSADETDRRRFEAEARTLAGLAHPGLVTVLDVGADEDRAFLVMELVTGGTLARSIAAGPLDADTVATVGVQTAAALAYAHDRGVVHRDVKPGNVLIDEKSRVKLADFGIARLVGDTVRHTRTGTAVGTAAYLAPEQVQGRDVTGAADVYALGLTLLEALTAERAYPGSPTEAALARLHRPPAIPDHLPAWWRDLLREMTDFDPARRPTAAAVAARLDPTTHGDDPVPTAVMPAQAVPAPTAPAPATPAPVSRAGADPARRAIALALGALGLLLVVAAVVAATADDTPDAPGPTEPTSQAPTTEPTTDPTTEPTTGPTRTGTPSPSASTPPAPAEPPAPDEDRKGPKQKGPKGPDGKGPPGKGGKKP